MILRNLRRMAGEGVDHKNEAHVQAYMVARQTTARPRPAQILAIVASSKVTVSSTTRLSSDFWLVPRDNFRATPPPQVMKAMVSEQELRQTHKVPVDTRLVDMCCPRELLGPRVKTVRFEEALSHGVSENVMPRFAAAELLDVASESSEATLQPQQRGERPRAQQGTSSAASGAGPPAAPARATAAEASVPSAAPAPVGCSSAKAGVAARTAAEAPCKKFRVLKEMRSEEVDKPEEHEATRGFSVMFGAGVRRCSPNGKGTRSGVQGSRHRVSVTEAQSTLGATIVTAFAVPENQQKIQRSRGICLKVCRSVREGYPPPPMPWV